MGMEKILKRLLDEKATWKKDTQITGGGQHTRGTNGFCEAVYVTKARTRHRTYQLKAKDLVLTVENYEAWPEEHYVKGIPYLPNGGHYVHRVLICLEKDGQILEKIVLAKDMCPRPYGVPTYEVLCQPIITQEKLLFNLRGQLETVLYEIHPGFDYTILKKSRRS